MRYLIGVDEAGRGPLAGPVAVGVTRVRSGFDWSLIPGVRDSKKLTLPQRERIYALMLAQQREGALRFEVAYASSALIDKEGMTKAVQRAMARALSHLETAPAHARIFLDGLLRAPEEYKNQQTIIGGDDVLPIISLAAIAAKVERDRLMIRLAKKYPSYGFEVHKGYGTLAHRRAIREWGLSEIHRTTFCTRLAQPSDAEDADNEQRGNRGLPLGFLKGSPRLNAALH